MPTTRLRACHRRRVIPVTAAATGWALGSAWTSMHQVFGVLAVLAAVLAVVALLALVAPRRLRQARS